jgi:hypothetical protein
MPEKLLKIVRGLFRLTLGVARMGVTLLLITTVIAFAEYFGGKLSSPAPAPNLQAEGQEGGDSYVAGKNRRFPASATLSATQLPFSASRPSSDPGSAADSDGPDKTNANSPPIEVSGGSPPVNAGGSGSAPPRLPEEASQSRSYAATESAASPATSAQAADSTNSGNAAAGVFGTGVSTATSPASVQLSWDVGDWDTDTWGP